VNGYATVHAVSCLMYNETPEKIARSLFPEGVLSYQMEWALRFDRGLGYAVSKMDTNTFKRFVDMAIAKYGDNATLYFPDERF
jgi:hypothetical protein